MPVRNRTGFALPMAVLALAVLAVALAGGIAATSSESLNSTSQESADRALGVAQSGLEQFIQKSHSVNTNGTGWCAAYGGSCSTNMQALLAAPPDSEYVAHLPVANGYADVKALRVKTGTGDPTNPHIYYLISRGVDTTEKSSASWMRSARPERTVGQYVNLQKVDLQVLSSFTSITGITKNGGSGTISGFDDCTAAQGGGKPAVAGVAVPTSPGYSQNGGTAVPTGNPAQQSIGANPAAAAASVKIDWDGIVNHNAVVPDIVIPGGSWPTAKWAADANNNPHTYYPVIKVIGDYAIPSQGRGTLIVTGNFTISGSDMWEGVLLVGGTITSNGNNTVLGATVSGLNMKLPGGSVGVNSLGNGNKDFEYNSCEVARATSAMGGYIPVTNTWTGNVASY